MTASNSQHELQSIFHPLWTPFDDCQLLSLRDQGVSLDRIAMALMRHPKVVEQRWHRLRVVPGVRAKLRAFGMNSSAYPVENPADVLQGSGVSAP